MIGSGWNTQDAGPGMFSNDASIGNLVPAAFRVGQSQSMLQGLIDNYRENQFDTAAQEAGQQKIEPEQLNKDPEFPPLPGFRFEVPQYRITARAQYERHSALVKDLSTLNGIDQWGPLPNPFSLRSIASFGANMAGSMANPVDLSLMFLPIVGEAGKAAAIAEAGGKTATLRALLARGMLDSSILPGVEQFPKLIPRIVNNMGQQFIVEIPKIQSEVKNRADGLDIGGLATDMLQGALGAEVMHGMVHLGLKGLNMIESRTFDAASKTALSDTIQGKNVDVSDHLKQDPNVVYKEALDATIKERVRQLSDEDTFKAKQKAEAKYESTKAWLEKDQAKLEEHYKNLGFDEEKAKAEAKDVVIRQMADLHTAAQAHVDATGAIATVDERTLHRIASDYVGTFKDEEKTPRVKVLEKMLGENPTGKFKKPGEAQRLANTLGLHLDNKPWLPAENLITSVIDRNPKNGAILRTLFDEPAVRQAVLDVQNRQHQILDTRIRDYVAKQKQKYIEAVFEAPRLEAKIAKTTEKLSRIEETRKMFGWDKPDPRYDTPEKVKAAIHDPVNPDVERINKQAEEVRRRLEAGGQEISKEDLAKIEGNEEDPSQGQMIDDNGKKILEEATACLSKYG